MTDHDEVIDLSNDDVVDLCSIGDSEKLASDALPQLTAAATNQPETADQSPCVVKQEPDQATSAVTTTQQPHCRATAAKCKPGGQSAEAVVVRSTAQTPACETQHRSAKHATAPHAPFPVPTLGTSASGDHTAAVGRPNRDPSALPFTFPAQTAAKLHRTLRATTPVLSATEHSPSAALKDHDQGAWAVASRTPTASKLEKPQQHSSLKRKPNTSEVLQPGMSPSVQKLKHSGVTPLPERPAKSLSQTPPVRQVHAEAQHAAQQNQAWHVNPHLPHDQTSPQVPDGGTLASMTTSQSAAVHVEAPHTEDSDKAAQHQDKRVKVEPQMQQVSIYFPGCILKQVAQQQSNAAVELQQI